jgi:hypothetical protein
MSSGSFISGGFVNWGSPLPASAFQMMSNIANASSANWIMATQDGPYLKMVMILVGVQSGQARIKSTAAR